MNLATKIAHSSPNNGSDPCPSSDVHLIIMQPVFVDVRDFHYKNKRVEISAKRYLKTLPCGFNLLSRAHLLTESKTKLLIKCI